mmetsp:Transcript_12006/g.10393  ORF Transcript_12006/g.10393 Transcript_12006/m.10393 type:complete len:141 (+) Transcript_12006:67-489(+)
MTQSLTDLRQRSSKKSLSSVEIDPIRISKMESLIDRSDPKEHTKAMLLDLGSELDRLTNFMNHSLVSVTKLSVEEKYSPKCDDLENVEELLGHVEAKIKKATDRYFALKKKVIELHTPQTLKVDLPKSLKLDKVLNTQHK